MHYPWLVALGVNIPLGNVTPDHPEENSWPSARSDLNKEELQQRGGMLSVLLSNWDRPDCTIDVYMLWHNLCANQPSLHQLAGGDIRQKSAKMDIGHDCFLNSSKLDKKVDLYNSDSNLLYRLFFFDSFFRLCSNFFPTVLLRKFSGDLLKLTNSHFSNLSPF